MCMYVCIYGCIVLYGVCRYVHVCVVLCIIMLICDFYMIRGDRMNIVEQLGSGGTGGTVGRGDRGNSVRKVDSMVEWEGGGRVMG